MTTLKVLSIPEPYRAGYDDVRRCSTVAAQGGIEITVLLPEGTKNYGADTHGVRVLTESVRHGALLPISSNLRGAIYPRLGAVLRETRPDVIHIDAPPGSALAQTAVRLRGRASLVLECEDQAFPPKFLPSWIIHFAERRVLSAADFVLARHYDTLNWARTRGFSGPGAVVAYGMKAVLTHSTIGRVGRVPGPALGYVGALSQESGVVELVEAVAACRVPLSLTMFGQGPLCEELSDRVAALRISDRVHIVDSWSDTWVQPVDVVVLTAQHGGCKPVDRQVAEMQALGIPVIAFGVPGGRELVGDAGWYVTKGDAGLLLHLLHQLAARPEEVLRAQAACIPHVQWRANLDVVGAELARAFMRARQSRAGTDIVGDVSLAASHGMKF